MLRPCSAPSRIALTLIVFPCLCRIPPFAAIKVEPKLENILRGDVATQQASLPVCQHGKYLITIVFFASCCCSFCLDWAPPSSWKWGEPQKLPVSYRRKERRKQSQHGDKKCFFIIFMIFKVLFVLILHNPSGSHVGWSLKEKISKINQYETNPPLLFWTRAPCPLLSPDPSPPKKKNTRRDSQDGKLRRRVCHLILVLPSYAQQSVLVQTLFRALEDKSKLLWLLKPSFAYCAEGGIKIQIVCNN